MWATLDSHHFRHPPTCNAMAPGVVLEASHGQRVALSRLRVVAVAQGQRAKRRDLGATEAPLLQSRIWRITRRLASLSLNEVERRFLNSTVIENRNGNVIFHFRNF